MRTAAPAVVARAEPGWRTPLVAWATSRALVIVLGVAASLAFGVPERGVDAAVPHALATLGGWDTTWYLDVARHGYAHDTGQVGEVFSNLAFFPLLPGRDGGGAGARPQPLHHGPGGLQPGLPRRPAGLPRPERRALRRGAANRATWALALLPTATYASLAYTEGIVLACAVGAALAGTRGRPGLAGLAAAAATLARPTGILVALLAGLLALRGPAVGRARRVALAVGPGIVALAVFLAWMAVARGSALLPFEAQRAWDRGQVGIGLVTAAPSEISAGWHHIVSGTGGAAWHATIRDLVFLALYLWLLVRLWRREGGLRSPWVAYSAAAIALPLSSGTITSMARFGLLAFPLMWPLGDWLGAERGRTARWAGAAVVVTALLVAQLTMRSP